jgi:hypothetical protein
VVQLVNKKEHAKYQNAKILVHICKCFKDSSSNISGCGGVVVWGFGRVGVGEWGEVRTEGALLGSFIGIRQFQF